MHATLAARSRHFRWRLTFALIAMLMIEDQALSEFIIMTNDGRNINNLYRKPLGPGSATKIGTVNYGGFIWELQSGPDRDTLYGIDRERDRLLTIDIRSSAVVAQVSLDANMPTNGRGFAVSPSGELFGIFRGKQLRSIDPMSGQTALIANLPGFIVGTEAITFDPRGILYATASTSGGPFGRQLYALDPSNGQMHRIGPIGNSHIDIDTMTWASDGLLYGVDTLGTTGTTLWRIDPFTGARSNISTLPGGVNGLHFIPEPGTGVLLVLFWGALRRASRPHRSAQR